MALKYLLLISGLHDMSHFQVKLHDRSESALRHDEEECQTFATFLQ